MHIEVFCLPGNNVNTTNWLPNKEWPEDCIIQFHDHIHSMVQNMNEGSSETALAEFQVFLSSPIEANIEIKAPHLDECEQLAWGRFVQIAICQHQFIKMVDNFECSKCQVTVLEIPVATTTIAPVQKQTDDDKAKLAYEEILKARAKGSDKITSELQVLMSIDSVSLFDVLVSVHIPHIIDNEEFMNDFKGDTDDPHKAWANADDLKENTKKNFEKAVEEYNKEVDQYRRAVNNRDNRKWDNVVTQVKQSCQEIDSVLAAYGGYRIPFEKDDEQGMGQIAIKANGKSIIALTDLASVHSLVLDRNFQIYDLTRGTY